MDGKMEGKMDEWKDRCMNGRLDEWMHGQMYEGKDGHKCMDQTWMNWWIDVASYQIQESIT